MVFSEFFKTGKQYIEETKKKINELKNEVKFEYKTNFYLYPYIIVFIFSLSTKTSFKLTYFFKFERTTKEDYITALYKEQLKEFIDSSNPESVHIARQIVFLLINLAVNEAEQKNEEMRVILINFFS